ncbi:MAG TPA: hypothetical protein VGE00_00690 [Gammaproteobacteria bacterium]
MVRLGRFALLALLTVAYYALLYYAAVTTTHPWLSVLLALVPVVALATLLVWGSPYRAWILGVGAVGMAAIWLIGGERIVANYMWFYLFQHAGVNAGLAIFFGMTLLGQSTPLITRFAAIVHEELTPGQLRYTRKVTAAWTLFFSATALLSVSLFLFAPIEAWAFFANALYLPMTILMFAGEYLVRLRVLPDIKHVSLAETLRISSRYFREKAAKRPIDSR